MNPAKITQLVSGGRIDDRQALSLIEASRKGVSYRAFAQFAKALSFSMADWARILNISGRTMQRLKKENRTLDQAMSERIFRIALLNERGSNVLGSPAGFVSWIESENVALGGMKPISLLDSTFGIDLVHDELTRIEHGILA